MGLLITLDTKTWAILLLLVGLSWGQNKNYFEWTPIKVPRQPSLPPASHAVPATTSSYDSRFYDSSAPYHGSTGYYPDSSLPYMNDDPYSQDSYSSDFPKSQPYPYPDDLSGSYESYGNYPMIRDENFNITREKYGGFGGTGDTRGYGAYDYPRKVQDVPQDLHEDPPSKIGSEFQDLLRLRSKVFHRRNPLHVHPLPPPL